MPIPQSILQPTPEHLLLDNLKTAVLVLDAELHVQYLNTAAEPCLKQAQAGCAAPSSSAVLPSQGLGVRCCGKHSTSSSPIPSARSN